MRLDIGRVDREEDRRVVELEDQQGLLLELACVLGRLLEPPTDDRVLEEGGEAVGLLVELALDGALEGPAVITQHVALVRGHHVTDEQRLGFGRELVHRPHVLPTQDRARALRAPEDHGLEGFREQLGYR